MSRSLEILAGCLSKLQDAAAGGNSSSFTELFPSLICVGGQSAGKSSIIETIVGHSFLPRGQDIVTRCPLKIRSGIGSRLTNFISKTSNIYLKAAQDRRGESEGADCVRCGAEV